MLHTKLDLRGCLYCVHVKCLILIQDAATNFSQNMWLVWVDGYGYVSCMLLPRVMIARFQGLCRFYVVTVKVEGQRWSSKITDSRVFEYVLSYLLKFISGKINSAYIHTSLTFLVSEMGLTKLAAQPVSVSRAKLWKFVMKCKKVMTIKLLGPFISKCTYLRPQYFFSQSTCPINFNFPVAVCICKIHVFVEALFPLSNILQLKNLFHVSMGTLVRVTNSFITIKQRINPNYPWENRDKQITNT